MAAPRQYSDQQRQQMFRLYEAGKTPTEIARLCEEGQAGTAQFTIPRRTVHDIVSKMAKEADLKLPTSVAESESAEVVSRFPVRIAGILDAEISRLEKRQEQHGLRAEDIECLKQAESLSNTVRSRLEKRPPIRKGAGQASAPQEPETAYERLAREEATNGSGGGDHPSETRTQRESTPEDAPDPREAAAEQARNALAATV